MSRGRTLWLGVAAVGAGAGYYLYQAGGDAKVAEKNFEHDAARLSSKVKNELPGKAKEVKTEAKSIGEQARSWGDKADSKIENAFAQAKAEGKDIGDQARGYSRDAQDRARQTASDAEKSARQFGDNAEAKFQEAKKETGNSLTKAVDSFDKTVESGAGKAKSTISSWFGGK